MLTKELLAAFHPRGIFSLCSPLTTQLQLLEMSEICDSPKLAVLWDNWMGSHMDEMKSWL